MFACMRDNNGPQGPRLRYTDKGHIECDTSVCPSNCIRRKLEGREPESEERRWEVGVDEQRSQVRCARLSKKKKENTIEYCLSEVTSSIMSSDVTRVDEFLVILVIYLLHTS